MPKRTETDTSKSELWRTEALFKLFSREEIVDLLAQGATPALGEKWARKQLDLIYDHALKVFADQHLPVKPGFYFKPDDGPIEFIKGSVLFKTPYEISERLKSQKGSFCIWPDIAGIDDLSSAGFARDLLKVIVQLRLELGHRDSPWRLVSLLLQLLDPYHGLATERADLAALALDGLKAKKARSSIAEKKKGDREVRLRIVQQVGLEHRRKRNKRQATAHELARADGVLKEINSRLLVAGMKKTIRASTVEKMLKELGF